MQVTIRIGAALDSSMAGVMKPWIASVKIARAQVDAEMKGVDASISKGYRDAPAHAKAGFKGASDAAKDGAKDIDAAMATASKSAVQHAQAVEGGWGKAFQGIASKAQATFGGMVRAGLGVANQITRAFGVNLDVGANIKEGLAQQGQATLLSHKGFQEGQAGVAGVRQDPNAIRANAQSAANATGRGTSEMLEGMTEFVNKSGSLQGARDMIGEIGAISNATGADLNSLAKTAGVLDLKLSDSFGADQAGKMKAISDIIRGIAAGGKLGAIDIEDMGAQIPKLVAAAGAFGGDLADRIKDVSVLAQESGKAGGSSTAAQAATAVAALPQQLRKDKTVAAFKKANIDVFTDKSHQTLRDPISIIKDALKSTNGAADKMSQLFRSTSVGRSAEGLRQTFVKAGGGEAGMKAVEAELASFGGALLSASEIEKENADVLKSGPAQARVFMNQLEELGGEVAGELLPAMKDIAPMALDVAKGLAGLVGWASKNPLEAVVAAMAASVAKAAIGEAIASAAGGAMTVGGPLIVAAVAFALGKILIDSKVDAIAQGVTNSTNADAFALNAEGTARVANKTGTITTSGAQDTESAAAMLKARIDAAENESEEEKHDTATRHIGRQIVGGSAQSQAENDVPGINDMKLLLAKLNTTLTAIHTGVIKVNDVSPKVPGVDPGGRSGPHK